PHHLTPRKSMTRALNIIAADDERYMREYYQELLPRLGHQVVLAEGGRQLVEQCRLLNPDLVIADVKMPDLDGLEAAAEVLRERAVPFILVTAHHAPDLMAKAQQRKVMAYLVKPVKQADPAAAIDLAMTRFEQMQALRQDAAGLRQALEERKLIERAKGVIVHRLGVSEDD